MRGHRPQILGELYRVTKGACDCERMVPISIAVTKKIEFEEYDLAPPSVNSTQ